MDSVQKYLALIVIFVGLLSNANGQINIKSTISGGELELPQTGQCLTESQRAGIQARLEINREKLVEKGILLPMEHIERNKITLFDWPLRSTQEFNQFDYVETTNFVDLDPGSGIRDYQCGARSYDGHQGVDYSLWPFWWMMMDNDYVEVVAAAPGTIIGKDDGYFDQNCQCTGSWNAVYIEHDDGTRAYYGHLKKNTLTNKMNGSRVESGEYLGLVGSSGCSTNPHLHFEIVDVDWGVIEPYAGACNQTTTDSWWNEQPAYFDPSLNALYTHDKAPGFAGFCPEDEEPNIQTQFESGERVFLAAYYHEQQQGMTTIYELENPEGIIIDSWSHSSPLNYSASFWYWSYVLPEEASQGEWIWRAKFNEEVYEKNFTVGHSTSVGDEDLLSTEIYPNPSVNELHIRLAYPLAQTLFQIVDIRGKVIYSEEIIMEKTIDISNFKRGIYFARILAMDGRVITTEKLLFL